MIREFEQIRSILNELRTLSNNIGFECDIDKSTLRKGIRFIQQFESEMTHEYERLQKEKIDNAEKEEGNRY